MTSQIDPAKPGSDITAVSAMARAGGRKVWIWRGRWYKPWTWFRFQTAYVLNDYQLVSWSVVRPPGPNRNGDVIDPRLFNRVMGEAYVPKERNDGPRLPRSSPL